NATDAIPAERDDDCVALLHRPQSVSRTTPCLAFGRSWRPANRDTLIFVPALPHPWVPVLFAVNHPQFHRRSRERYGSDFRSGELGLFLDQRRAQVTVISAPNWLTRRRRRLCIRECGLARNKHRTIAN